MFPDEEYAPPKGSFNTPVPTPQGDPTAAPTKSFTIACEWLPYIRGALQQLLLQATWKVGNPAQLALVQARAATLISLFTECAAAINIACGYGFPPLDQEGWTVVQRGSLTPPGGSYSLLGGFDSTSSFESGGNDWWDSVTIERQFSNAFDVYDVSFTYDLTLGSDYHGDLASNPSGIILWNGGSVVASDLSSAAGYAPGADINHSHDFGGVSADRIWITMLAGVNQFNTPTGTASVTSAGVTGIGAISGC